jgi:hypothetical protein
MHAYKFAVCAAAAAAAAAAARRARRRRGCRARLDRGRG